MVDLFQDPVPPSTDADEEPVVALAASGEDALDGASGDTLTEH
jgi:hypothetical protein